MSDRDMLRCGLMLFAAASMLLVACPRREPLLCGAQESCPRGLVCSEGICIKDREDEPDACIATEYALVDGECRLECSQSTMYPSEAACCDAHPEACDNAIDRCPSEPPGAEEVLVALVDLRCEYGEECCCGSCQPSKICTALAGEELGCFNTDWCLNPSCQEP
jgi:hypothetical protein